ncbi:aminotransferase class I/II-fold pyridoxal phosphate-dependent enzyme [Streptomyces sp. TRM 70351]|uniref:aminotransferase class I/II-fold pyridoxal phosphate-dependent enzyme n=1 Tax=Streptomyces sp. TRM 70351 TaxID=3116552 RepID=UPI002E7BD6EB|nr:aminotransferase class I/II-fold pyridoxal phosphate-dependent enzyme [Streptomyces sp. TRM 70351]MEE1926941.1 aminotransferase class I/II-fold pyridoxal phosphate-dependent enzyme [Streptomyces sp. TRM 70351]
MRDSERDDPVAVAACGYWRRRGLPTGPAQVVVAPGAPLLLLALLAAAGNGHAPGPGVLLPRPGPVWHAAQAGLLGRAPRAVPSPAECGGVPDPFALLETVRRERSAGAAPGVLLLSVADDPSGTVAPPELLHEVCEAAAGEGLLVVSDESWRDTVHDPHATVVVSPAEMLHAEGAGPENVVVLTALDAAPDAAEPPAAEAGTVPDGPAAGLARFPPTARGAALADGVRRVLDALGPGPLPVPAARSAAAYLADSADALRQRAARARAYGRYADALCRTLTAAGALCRPPQAGRHLYPDFEPLREVLAARGVTGAAALEAALTLRLGAGVLGGHRFGDDPHALRVRLPARAEPPDAPGALDRVEAALAGLAAGGPVPRTTGSGR